MSTTGISFHRQSVEVVTADTQLDRYGNNPPNWDSYTAVVVDGCRILPAQGGEALDRRTRDLVLFAPPDTVLDGANRIRWDGVLFDVLDVRRWSSPTGRLAHLEADLRRVEG